MPRGRRRETTLLYDRTSTESGSRQRRLANEALAHVGEGEAEAEFPLACECGDAGCRAAAPQALFEHVGRHAGHYLVSAGCHDSGAERTVEHGGDYVAVVPTG